MKFLGSYTVPKIDVQIGASYQNIPGIELSANYAVLNSDVARPVAQGGLGRLPGSAVSATATTTVALIAPQTEYYDRLNQLDLRLGKILKYGRTRANVSLDLYNLFNKGTISGGERHVRDVAGADRRHLAAIDEGVVDVRLLDARHRSLKGRPTERLGRGRHIEPSLITESRYVVWRPALHRGGRVFLWSAHAERRRFPLE